MATFPNPKPICFKCGTEEEENLRKEKIEDTVFIICDQCWELDKCSICYDLFEGESFKLHDDVNCCKEVKLCEGCRDHLRSINTTSCPVCKHDPSPQEQQQEQPQEYIYIISPQYQYITPDYQTWISTITGRTSNLYNYNTGDIMIQLPHFLENEMHTFGTRFQSFQFNYVQNMDIILMKIYYYCLDCPRIHSINYQFELGIEDTPVIENTDPSEEIQQEIQQEDQQEIQQEIQQEDQQQLQTSINDTEILDIPLGGSSGIINIINIQQIISDV